MVRRAVRERLAQDIGGWLSDGLISAETHDLLRERYAARHFGLASAVKYLGLSGAFFAIAGVLGLISMLSGSEGLAAFFLCATGSALTMRGIRLAADQQARYPGSSQLLLALGVFIASAGVAVLLHTLGAPAERLSLITGAFVLPIVGLLAYRHANTLLLVLALLGFFHWVGSWSAMTGRSAYELSIDDERVMSLAALLVIGAGLGHELRLRARTGRFYQAYEAIGLVYLNLSLLIMSQHDRWGPTWFWILLFALLGVAQIVLGARLHNALFTGFGVSAVALNLYTRYFELCWGELHAGVFFLLGGGALLMAGVGCEIALKRLRAEPT